MEKIEKLKRCYHVKKEAESKLLELKGEYSQLIENGLNNTARLFRQSIDTLEPSIKKLDSEILFLENELNIL